MPSENLSVFEESFECLRSAMCVPSKSSLSAFKCPLSAFEEPAPAAIITVIIIIITIIFIILSGFG